MPYLKSIGDFADLDIDGFVSDTALRKAFAERGQDYDAALGTTANPSALSGQDPVCNVAVTDPTLAGEAVARRHRTPPSPPPTPAACCAPSARPPPEAQKVRAAYVPDAEFGTRWFADKSVWVRDGSDYLPFDTAAGAQRYTAAHPGATVVDYQQALAGAV